MVVLDADRLDIMKDQILEILKSLDEWIQEEKNGPESFRIKPINEIVLLGQVALLIDDQVRSSLNPVATIDVDAWLEMDFAVEIEFKKRLVEKGLELDLLSKEIWLRNNYEKELFYEGEYLTCYKVAPLDLLLSKAIKAPKKNKKLIQSALVDDEIGEELIRLIESEGGDLGYFLNES